MKKKVKVRIDNELIDIFTNLPKSTNTAMSWLLLHKSMEQSVISHENRIEFNLLDFIDDYSIDYSRKFDLKKELVRDFKKLKNRVEKEYINERGNKGIKTFYFFQETDIDLETLDVVIKLNEKIYNSVSSIPDKNYFQYLKQEAIMIANKKMSPIDLKLLMYLKSQSHSSKLSYVKIKIEELIEILGQSSSLNWYKIKTRHIDPFIERSLKNTNYVISYEVQKNKLNKRKIESILFTVDNRKEKLSIINKNIDKDTIKGDEIANKYFTELEPQFEDMEKHEEKVENNIKSNKSISKEEILESLIESENSNMNNTQLIDEAWVEEENDVDFLTTTNNRYDINLAKELLKDIIGDDPERESYLLEQVILKLKEEL